MPKQGEIMRYVQGIDRQQTTLLPEMVDDYITENNPVRFIDVFVDGLDIQGLGFKYSQTKETGRKPYNPSDLLKLYIYGYLNKVRSSRRLEKATYQNIELIWLLHKLHPDFKTIADFRKDNLEPIRQVCREFTLLCKKLDLFGCELIAIDGSKFSAVNSNRRTFTKNKLNKLIQKIDEQIDGYLKDLDQGDRSEQNLKSLSVSELNERIEQLKKRKNRYQQLQSQIEQSGEIQVSLTDPDSRMMKTQHGKDVVYNVQIVTDSKHKLIVTHEVTNDINDMKQLHSMAIQAKEIFEAEELDAVADAGYWERDNIKTCHEEKIEVYVPKPEKSHNKSQGFYTKSDFKYDPVHDCYHCPAGETLMLRGMRKKNGFDEKIYTTSACYQCPLKSKCSKNKQPRRIYRWVHEEVMEELNRRMHDHPEMIKRRKGLVEHPFGTLKHGMDHGYFLLRGKPKVSAEMALSVLSYNLKRTLNIVNFKELMLAVQ
jgi:transposase